MTYSKQISDINLILSSMLDCKTRTLKRYTYYIFPLQALPPSKTHISGRITGGGANAILLHATPKPTSIVVCKYANPIHNIYVHISLLYFGIQEAPCKHGK